MIRPDEPVWTPDMLKRLRKDLGLSQSEFAAALGFGAGGDRTVRAWEDGHRDGEPFAPTGLAWAAIRYLTTLSSLKHRLALGGPQNTKIALRIIDMALPEKMR